MKSFESGVYLLLGFLQVNRGHNSINKKFIKRREEYNLFFMLFFMKE